MEFTWMRTTLSGVVSNTPAKVGSVIVTPGGASDKADITLYDGESTTDPPLLTIRTLTGETKVINFQPFLQTQRGLYVEEGAHVEEVLIQLLWEKEGEVKVVGSKE